MTNFAWDIYNELIEQLPYIANILNTHKDNIKIFEHDINRPYPNNNIIIKQFGLISNMSFITKDNFKTNLALHAGGGLELIKCRNNPLLRYIRYYTRKKEGHYEWFCMCKKEDYLKILFHYYRSRPKVTNIISPILANDLLDDIKNNTINFIKKRKKLKLYNTHINRGLIFDGPPGNGKTLACRWIQDLCCNERKYIPSYTISSSDIDEAYNNNRLAPLFNQEGILFFDDIDISYLDRKSGNGKMACAILNAMDGIDYKNSDTNTVRIFTTNERIDSLDPAFVRPGRIDKKFTFNKPTTELRKRFIDSWMSDGKIKITEIDIDNLVNITEGCSFAEIGNLRTNLIINFIDTNQWDVNKVIDDFKNSTNTFEVKKSLGFSK